MGGGMNMQAMMKQAQKLQEQMKQAQEEIKTTEVEGSAGGGMVTVTMTGDKRVTAVLSNMGRLSVPEKLTPYVRSFSAFSSAKTLFTVVTSYGDDLVLGTASALRSTNVLSRLYRGFVQNGLAVTLYATEVEK